MNLPIQPPYAPMEAMLVEEIPTGDYWQYEPKWDGFRCLVFREGNQVQLQSRSGQDLTRYFPELVDAFSRLKCAHFVLDGEIAVPIEGRFSFDDLLQRIHPAASRVQRLAREHPAIFILFDLLVTETGKRVVDQPLGERRPLLEAFAAKCLKGHKQIRLSPATTELAQAKHWFKTVGGDLDGIVAKRLDLPYQSGERAGMQKIKQQRTADCVVGGFRYASNSKVIGSLLLGLYNAEGLLDHVGFCSGLTTEDRKSLTTKLEPLIEPPGFTGHAPGGLSRWSTKRSMEWQPLKPKLVVEVSYDHFTGGRFRHGTKLIRWRPDKAPGQCQMDQVLRTRTSRSLALL
ncbi:MAG TPA: ATP-dependent DNA ligase [Verrucomicrobiae bacterium]|nr:ATP-dependent DNA ligase [Verrucomicrobiae bacterium]